jgi:hypothetical protein
MKFLFNKISNINKIALNQRQDVKSARPEDTCLLGTAIGTYSPLML